MNRKSGKTGIIITIIILIIIVILTHANFSKLEQLVSQIVMPVQNSLTYVKNKVSNNDDFFISLEELKRQNSVLKNENETLKENLREMEILKAENAVLAQYANLTEEYAEYQTVPAYIINKDVSNLSNIIVINVGTKDGVKENMTVIANKGLVGYVISVSENTAKVQTILDAGTNVSSLISTSREGIVLKGILGSETTLKGMYIPTDAVLITGDEVETSGIGGIYPKGIAIGKIRDIIETKNITDRYIIVETAVDFTKLETVLVITK
ncbi:MAG: rod shape-determining protein MreC [Lachnospiraceae bacterium]|nr:rod shape-determining protein MreC [Lachnospiraceae bacterium]